MLQLILSFYLLAQPQSPTPGCGRTEPKCEPRQLDITSVRVSDKTDTKSKRIMTQNLTELSDDLLLELHQNLHAVMLGHPVSGLPCPSELRGLLHQLEGDDSGIAALHRETEDAIANRPSITETINQMMHDLTDPANIPFDGWEVV